MDLAEVAKEKAVGDYSEELNKSKKTVELFSLARNIPKHQQIYATFLDFIERVSGKKQNKNKYKYFQEECKK